ncbi:hypothetical protein E2C01_015077 [Portunus trituberculatus]|uniref:Uncharacterized protein n=1 Tax=Portunus trituberculatus TaxID=210409 RepID=A0A5B7DKD2_PORTR|nr:hypothetical protein [Portunus trituberculatus]
MSVSITQFASPTGTFLTGKKRRSDAGGEAKLCFMPMVPDLSQPSTCLPTSSLLGGVGGVGDERRREGARG